MASANSNGAIRVALSLLDVGRSAGFALPEGETPRKFSMRVCWQAHRVFGKGCYRSSTDGDRVWITRASKPEATPAPVPQPVAPPAAANDDQRVVAHAIDAGDQTLLTRKQAADFLRPWFPQGISAEQLRAFCNEGRGPAGERNGRFVLHRVGALRAWADNRLRPIGGQEAA